MVIQIEELVPFDENEEPIMDAEVTRIRMQITRGGLGLPIRCIQRYSP
jgi:hypothetical protein